MKYLTSLFAALVMLVGMGFAQDAQIADLKNQLDAAFGDRGTLHDEFNNQEQEKKSLDSQGKDVVLDQQSYDKALAKHNAWAADQNKQAADHDLAFARLTQLYAPLKERQTAVQSRFATNQQQIAQHTANR